MTSSIPTADRSSTPLVASLRIQALETAQPQKGGILFLSGPALLQWALSNSHSHPAIYALLFRTLLQKRMPLPYELLNLQRPVDSYLVLSRRGYQTFQALLHSSPLPQTARRVPQTLPRQIPSSYPHEDLSDLSPEEACLDYNYRIGLSLARRARSHVESPCASTSTQFPLPPSGTCDLPHGHSHQSRTWTTS